MESTGGYPYSCLFSPWLRAPSGVHSGVPTMAEGGGWRERMIWQMHLTMSMSHPDVSHEGASSLLRDIGRTPIRTRFRGGCQESHTCSYERPY